MKFKLAGILTALSLLFVAFPNAQSYAAVANWQQGISIQPVNTTDFASTSFERSVDNAVNTGINHVTLVIPVYQSNISATDIAPGYNTPTDAALASGARYIKTKGMEVSFAVHVNSNDGQWRATINPGDRTSWFANYGAVLNRYAVIAQTAGVAQYVLGTELSDMTNPNVNVTNTANWNKLIQDVRSRYTGSLTYSAQHSYYKSDLMSIAFWPQLDKIGVSAYYGLSDEATPTLANVKANWERWNNEQIRTISERYSKPVIFTEVGYVSRDYGLRDPGSGFTLTTAYNDQTQAIGYQALFEYWDPFAYMQGVSLWDWKSNPNAGGAGDGDYTPQNKPAQDVMKQWFTAGPTTAPAPAPSDYSANVSASPQPTQNNQATISAAFTSSKPVSGVIVDVEIYNAAGQRVAQQFFENQSLSSAAKSYELKFVPTTTGSYTARVGVFTANWQSNLYWNNAAATFTVLADAPAPQPTQPAPTQPTPTPNPAPQPTQPAQPANGTVSIWWPGEGTTVSGVQPFKAVLDGRDTSQYKMFWQVDGGAMNLMGEGSDPIAHKLSNVDLTNWNWSPTKRYAIRFIAYDLAGNKLGDKTANVTINN